MKKSDILSVTIRLYLLVLSAIGWLTLTVGGWLQYTSVKITADKDKLKDHIAFLAPFFLLWLGTIPSYILTVAHLIMNLRFKNAVHIMHCVMIGCNAMLGAIGVLSIAAALLYLNVSLLKIWLPNLDYKYLRIMLSGVIMILLFQWISSFIWPLFNFERHPQRQDYQELEESTNLHTNKQGDIN